MRYMASRQGVWLVAWRQLKWAKSARRRINYKTEITLVGNLLSPMSCNRLILQVAVSVLVLIGYLL